MTPERHKYHMDTIDQLLRDAMDAAWCCMKETGYKDVDRETAMYLLFYQIRNLKPPFSYAPAERKHGVLRGEEFGALADALAKDTEDGA